MTDLPMKRELLEQALAADPGSTLFYKLALVYKEGGEKEKALDLLRRGLSIRPDHLEARILLGLIYYDEGWLDKARKELEAGWTLLEKSKEAYRILGFIYLAQGKKAEAEKVWRLYLILSPEDEEIKYQVQGMGLPKEELKPKEWVPEPEKLEPPRTVSDFISRMETRELEIGVGKQAEGAREPDEPGEESVVFGEMEESSLRKSHLEKAAAMIREIIELDTEEPPREKESLKIKKAMKTLEKWKDKLQKKTLA